MDKLEQMFERIEKLVRAKSRGGFGTRVVTVKNVRFETAVAATRESGLKEVKVTERTGFLGLKKTVVFYGERFITRDRGSSLDIIKYVPGEWENLIEEIL